MIMMGIAPSVIKMTTSKYGFQDNYAFYFELI